jgi:hypothetical protein
MSNNYLGGKLNGISPKQTITNYKNGELRVAVSVFECLVVCVISRGIIANDD